MPPNEARSCISKTSNELFLGSRKRGLSGVPMWDLDQPRNRMAERGEIAGVSRGEELMAHPVRNGQRLGRLLSRSFETADPKAFFLAM